MFKPIVLLGVAVTGLAALPASSWSQQQAVPAHPARTLAFDRADALKEWTITGDVTIDTARGSGDKGGSLRVGPRGKAPLLHQRRLGGAGSGAAASARRE
jgi:hypothetical protein